MNRQDYYPSVIEEQVLWLQHFATQLPHLIARLQVNAEEAMGAVADALWLAYVLGRWRTQADNAAKAITAALKHAQDGTGTKPLALPLFEAPPLPDGVVPRPPGALKRVFAMVQFIKRSRGYGEDIGALLGLHTRVDLREHPLPTFTLSVKTGEESEIVVLRVRRWGREAVCAQSRRGDGDWEDLGLCFRNLLEDARPLLVPGQPEVREYRFRWWENGRPAGDWTEVGKITVSPV